MFGTVVFLWLLFGIFSMVIANGKGRSGCGWGLIGLLLGPFGLLVAALPSLKRVNDPFAPHPDTHLRCPDCAELVLRAARVCKHCGCKLRPD